MESLLSCVGTYSESESRKEYFEFGILVTLSDINVVLSICNKVLIYNSVNCVLVRLLYYC
jgi:hypothetical protein